MTTSKEMIASLYDVVKSMQQELHEVKEAVVQTELTEEDLEFIEGTRQAQKEIDEGKGITLPAEEFLKKLESLM